MKNQKNGLGSRIRKARKKLNWSQDKLAEMIDVSKNMVSRYENGENPSLSRKRSPRFESR